MVNTGYLDILGGGHAPAPHNRDVDSTGPAAAQQAEARLVDAQNQIMGTCIEAQSRASNELSYGYIARVAQATTDGWTAMAAITLGGCITAPLYQESMLQKFTPASVSGGSRLLLAHRGRHWKTRTMVS